MFLRDFPGIGNIAIHHCNQFTIGCRGVLVSMPFAEVANTNHSNLE